MFPLAMPIKTPNDDEQGRKPNPISTQRHGENHILSSPFVLGCSTPRRHVAFMVEETGSQVHPMPIH